MTPTNGVPIDLEGEAIVPLAVGKVVISGAVVDELAVLALDLGVEAAEEALAALLGAVGPGHFLILTNFCSNFNEGYFV